MIFTHPITQIIQQRFSCRNYQEKPIEATTRRQLAEYTASQQEGPFGTQVRFELVTASEQDWKTLQGLGTYGFIRGATGFIIGALREGEKDLEDYGYLMERMILFATDLGLGTCWLGGTFTKSSFAEKISVLPGELVPAVSAVGYAARKPHWLERLVRRGATADRRIPWEQLFFKNNFEEILSQQAAGDYATPLEMVRRGPSASNRQPWRVIKDATGWHFYLQRTPGYRESTLVKLFTVADMQRMDLGIAMCHFELTARELGLGGHWERCEPRIEKLDELTEYTVSWIG